MAEVEIQIGGRVFEVACQAGEEHYLQAAAKMLDDEAQVLAAQIGRIPEPRMLLMAGLMLADKTAGLEDRVAELRGQLEAATSENEALKARPADQVEVPVIPPELGEAMAEIAARAESLAGALEEKLA